MALNKNAKAWVAALRSGKYKRGEGSLRPSEDTYCCLGVACDLYSKAMLKENKRSTWRWNDVHFFGPKRQESILPRQVTEWLGLNSCSGFTANDEELADLNDAGKSFKWIAKFIESEPEGLFRKKSK